MRPRDLVLAGVVLILASSAAPLRGQNSDISKTRSLAEAQHEIVMILIKKKDFDRAAEEANKIFQMKWPDDQEPILLKELLDFSTQFLRNSQPALAIRLLEANIGMFKFAQSKVAIWKEKGYVLEKMGQPDKALDCFREAQRLETLQPAAPPKKVKKADTTGDRRDC